MENMELFKLDSQRLEEADRIMKIISIILIPVIFVGVIGVALYIGILVIVTMPLYGSINQSTVHDEKRKKLNEYMIEHKCSREKAVRVLGPVHAIKINAY
jgi:hypothetical protein